MENSKKIGDRKYSQKKRKKHGFFNNKPSKREKQVKIKTIKAIWKAQIKAN